MPKKSYSQITDLTRVDFVDLKTTPELSSNKTLKPLTEFRNVNMSHSSYLNIISTKCSGICTQLHVSYHPRP